MPASTNQFEQLAASVLRILPRFTPIERRLSVALYRLLAEGRPVRLARLAVAAGIAEREATAILGGTFQGLAYQDDARDVIGFGGLAIVPMRHRFMVGDQTLYTWCAWDALFIPEMLGRPALVESPCPQTGERIELAVTPHGIRDASHPNAVVSFNVPDSLGADVHETIASFCHHVFFLASAVAGDAWAVRHPGTVLVSLDQAFELGQRKNAAQFRPDAESARS